MSCRKQEIIMVFACLLWGSSYLFMKEGLSDMHALNLVAWRFTIAFLIPCLLMWKKVVAAEKKTLLITALPGLLLYLVLYFLAEGVKLTSASNASFLIGTSVVIVPILAHLLHVSRLNSKDVITTMVVIGGIWLLTGSSGIGVINLGDLFCLAGAIARAVQILLLDKLSQKNYDMLILGLFQLGWASAFGMIFDILFNTFSIPTDTSDVLCLVALALLCTSVGFILQAKAQTKIKPGRLAVIFTLEPVFTAVLSMILFGQFLSARESIGAALILCGLFLSSKNEKTF